MIKKLISVAVITASLSAATTAVAVEKSKAADNASTYIISPADGQVVSSPVTVVFGLNGMGVAPAGSNLDNTGHHHLIIDAPLPDTSMPIPSDENYRHFGKGQTETTVELTSGEHTLQLLVGDWLHTPHDNVISSKQITITVR